MSKLEVAFYTAMQIVGIGLFCVIVVGIMLALAHIYRGDSDE